MDVVTHVLMGAALAYPFLPEYPFEATAFAFGCVHAQYDLYGVLTALALGVFLGFARWRTGSVYVSFACHAFLNLLATLEAALLG